MKFYNRVMTGRKTKNSDFGGNSVLDSDHRHSCSASDSDILIDICYYDFFWIAHLTWSASVQAVIIISERLGQAESIGCSIYCEQ